MNRKKLVLIGDDQAQVRSALNLLLAQYDALEIAGEAADASSLLLAVAQKHPDLLLLDWELPSLPIVQLVRLLWFEQPLLRIVAMSSRPEAEPQAMNAGVQLFLSKNDPPDRVRAAIHELLIDTGPTIEQNTDLLR
jgi:DNA-binding NarL/FixJ family response regulator